MNGSFFKYFILPTILFLAALAIGYWVLMPLYGYIGVALETKIQNKNVLVERQKLVANLAQLMGQYNERASDVAFFDRAIPVGQNIAELLVNLEALASENGLIFSSVDFKSKELEVNGVKTLLMEIKLKGLYPALQNYIKALEKSLRIFDVVSISFSGISPEQLGIKTSSEIDFTLSVNTYYQ